MPFQANDGPIILIVEDEKFMRDLIKRMLENIRYKNVIAVATGEEAVAQIEDNSGIIECILLDIELPDMSGIEFLRILRSQPPENNPNIPVVMVTGHSERRNVEKALELGVSHFLTKPLAPVDLGKAIDMALRGFVIDPKQL